MNTKKIHSFNRSIKKIIILTYKKTIRMKIKADIQEISLNKKKGILYKNKFKNTLRSMRKK